MTGVSTFLTAMTISHLPMTEGTIGVKNAVQSILTNPTVAGNESALFERKENYDPWRRNGSRQVFEMRRLQVAVGFHFPAPPRLLRQP